MYAIRSYYATDKVNALVSATLQFFKDLCTEELPREQLLVKCQRLLDQHKLTPKDIVEKYIEEFEIVNN